MGRCDAALFQFTESMGANQWVRLRRSKRKPYAVEVQTGGEYAIAVQAANLNKGRVYEGYVAIFDNTG